MGQVVSAASDFVQSYMHPDDNDPESAALAALTKHNTYLNFHYSRYEILNSENGYIPAEVIQASQMGEQRKNVFKKRGKRVQIQNQNHQPHQQQQLSSSTDNESNPDTNPDTNLNDSNSQSTTPTVTTTPTTITTTTVTTTTKELSKPSTKPLSTSKPTVRFTEAQVHHLLTPQQQLQKMKQQYAILNHPNSQYDLQPPPDLRNASSITFYQDHVFENLKQQHPQIDFAVPSYFEPFFGLEFMVYSESTSDDDNEEEMNSINDLQNEISTSINQQLSSESNETTSTTPIESTESLSSPNTNESELLSTTSTSTTNSTSTSNQSLSKLRMPIISSSQITTNTLAPSPMQKHHPETPLGSPLPLQQPLSPNQRLILIPHPSPLQLTLELPQSNQQQQQQQEGQQDIQPTKNSIQSNLHLVPEDGVLTLSIDSFTSDGPSPTNNDVKTNDDTTTTTTSTSPDSTSSETTDSTTTPELDQTTTNDTTTTSNESTTITSNQNPPPLSSPTTPSTNPTHSIKSKVKKQKRSLKCTIVDLSDMNTIDGPRLQSIQSFSIQNNHGNMGKITTVQESIPSLNINPNQQQGPILTRVSASPQKNQSNQHATNHNGFVTMSNNQQVAKNNGKIVNNNNNNTSNNVNTNNQNGSNNVNGIVSVPAHMTGTSHVNQSTTTTKPQQPTQQPQPSPLKQHKSPQPQLMGKLDQNGQQHTTNQTNTNQSIGNNGPITSKQQRTGGLAPRAYVLSSNDKAIAMKQTISTTADQHQKQNAQE